MPASTAAPARLALARVECRSLDRLTMTIDAIGTDGRIDDRFSAYHDDAVPNVIWTPAPRAGSYVLIVEDPDAPMDKPFVHWLLWNIPGAANAIPGGLARTPRPDALPGAVQGLNGGGSPGWFGVKPPPGHGIHHYHFQLFALEGRLDALPPDAGLDALVAALHGRVIAATERVGTYERR